MSMTWKKEQDSPSSYFVIFASPSSLCETKLNITDVTTFLRQQSAIGMELR